MNIAVKDIEMMEYKSMIIYDYLDEIHSDISRTNVDHIFKRLEYMKKHADIFITTTDSLYDETVKTRPKGTYLISNGVDYDHFHIKRSPASILRIC